VALVDVFPAAEIAAVSIKFARWESAPRAGAQRRNGIDPRVNPEYSTIMSIRLTIDKAGRVVIPKPLREELHLEPGDALEMESAGEEITLRPVRGTGPLTKEHGVWVFHAGQPLPASATDRMLQQIRDERDLANRGKGE
jgi:AbrB family looped-hinge helix DNA binding protein